MPEEKAPSAGAFLPASLRYFCSGKLMHLCSGVDSTRAITSSPQHAESRAETDLLVQIQNILIVHADASMGHEPADRAGIVGPMDCVFAAAAQGHRRGPHRVARTAARDDSRQPGIVPSNRGRRRPSRLDVFSVDGGRSRPGHASLADTHRIADRLSVADNVIEAPLVRLYDDRARRIAIEADDLPGTGRRGRQDAGDYKRQNTQQNDTHV